MPFSRRVCFSFPLWLAMGGSSVAATKHVEVMSTNGCGCCRAWTKHLEKNGYTSTVENLTMGEPMERKLAVGLTPDLVACHTGKIEGYVIEGHVPARDIDRLLAKRPEAVGLTVPGMPYGSPGMGDPPAADPYEVLLFCRDGLTEVFARYP